MGVETNILLPAARVDLFLKDKETLEAARDLTNDWRFARVDIQVHEGNVENAISTYQETASPALALIETDTTNESFIARLGALSSHCTAETNAIIIGPVNDVNLYRSLTSMGVSDYLVKPVPLKTLSEVIASALIAQLGTSDSRLIAVVGAKGGVGTSALTQGLAWGLSENLNQKTCLMDAAGGWSSLSVGLGFEPLTNLAEAARAAENADEDTLARMFFQANDKLNVLASGSDAMLDESVTAAQFEMMIDLMMQSYPVVLVDLSGAIPSLKRAVLNKAHEILVVTTPTLTALRAARTLMNEIKLLHGGETANIDLIVNMEGMMASKEVPKKDIATALDYTPALSIPFDPKLFMGSENEGKKITAQKAGAEIIDKLLPLAQKVLSSGAVKPAGNSNNDILSQFLGKIGLGKAK